MSDHKPVTTIVGTPFEAGAEVWEKFVLPCFVAARGRPDKEVQQFYAGILSACMGAMVADFGHERAVSILRTLADSLDMMRDEFPGARTQ